MKKYDSITGHKKQANESYGHVLLLSILPTAPNPRGYFDAMAALGMDG